MVLSAGEENKVGEALGDWRVVILYRTLSDAMGVGRGESLVVR
jgi:hypothetical protein